MNKHVAEDLLKLRDELVPRAFDPDGRTKDSTLAEVVFKINSVLYRGYPKRVDDRDSLVKSVDIIGDR